ncbi:MAG: hypothetical protein PHV63_04665 [Candidatus Daviesbacteria bacterium]|nr:hypothetical protein [Candidatus Daviesbacteria bacterium]
MTNVIEASTTFGDLAQRMAKGIEGCNTVSYTGRVFVCRGCESFPVKALSNRYCVDFPEKCLVPEMSAAGLFISWLEGRTPGLKDPTLTQIYNFNREVRRGFRRVVRFDSNGLVDQ